MRKVIFNRSRYGLLTFAMSLTASLTKGRSLLTTLLVPMLIISHASAQEPELTRDDPKDFVSITLPYNIDVVYDRIKSLFDSDGRDYYDDYTGTIYDLPDHLMSAKNLSEDRYKKFLEFPIVKPSKFYVFYGAYANMQHVIDDTTPIAAMGHSNAALQRYAALPPDARSQDIYLWSPDSPFWYSEYSFNGHPVPFRSYFILHLSEVDESHTTVEAIEDQPTVEMGRKLSVDEHGTVHHHDIREVEPTTSDREFLLSCVRQYIDRKLPARHWFNCKTQAELDAPPPTPFTVP